MRRNWILKVLVACNGLMAAGLAYEAYHSATYLWGFPDAPAMRWMARFEELFPTLGAAPRFLLELTKMSGHGGLFAGDRWFGVIFCVVLAAATGALTYGLAQQAKWARTTFAVTAVVQLVVALRKLGPMTLHLWASGRLGVGGYLSGLSSERVPPPYTVLGAFTAAGVAWLFWRWKDEPENGAEQSSGPAAPQRPSIAFSARGEAKHRGMSRWTWAMRAALLVQLIAFTLVEFSSPATWKSGNISGILSWVIWIALVGSLWYLLSLEDPRFGVGLGLGCACVQLLPALGLPFLLLFGGFRTWLQMGSVLLGALAVPVLLVAGIAGSISLGRAPLQAAGVWGFGLLLPFIAATVFFQVLQESTYAKAPVRSRELTIQQSHEYERGNAAHQMVHSIAKCVFEYSVAHPQEGFPEKLEQLRSRGASCPTREPGKPFVEGYEFDYQSSSHGSGGPRDLFTLRSRDVQHAPGTFSLPNTEVDQTGVFVRLEGAHPFSFSPALALMNNVAGCLKQDFVAHGEGSYPTSLRDLLSIKAEYGIPCIAPYAAKELSVIELWSNRFQYSSYTFSYAPTEAADGEFKGFQLEARPQEYGKVALRSYLTDQSGIVHGTPLNRAATLRDPDAACEAKQQNCSLP